MTVFSKPRSQARIFRSVKKALEEQYNNELQSLHVPYKYEVASGGSKNVKRILGDQIWNDIQNTLVEIFPECWSAQETLVQALVTVNVRRIYGQELDFVIDRLIKENDWDPVKIKSNILLIICPRRFGKTAATAAVVAALMICVPHFEHVHFSLTLELAGVFMEDVKRLILKSEKGKKMLVKRHRKGKIILKKNKFDVRVSKCLAANANDFLFLDYQHCHYSNPETNLVLYAKKIHLKKIKRKVFLN